MKGEKISEIKNVNNDQTKKNNLKLKLEQQVAVGLWIQVIGQITESLALSQLLTMSDDPFLEDEKTIVLGAWVKTIGQLLEAIGVSEQISVKNEGEGAAVIVKGQKIAVTGDWLQAFGALLDAIAG